MTNAEGDLSRITVTVNGITQSVSDLETGLSQTLRIAPNGVTITNARGDTLTIDGGQIDATNLNLSGHITFNDFSSRLQDDFDHVEQTAQDAYDIADKNRLPNYIKSTYIDSTEIRSPTIKANEFSVYPQAAGGGASICMVSITVVYTTCWRFPISQAAPHPSISPPLRALWRRGIFCPPLYAAASISATQMCTGWTWKPCSHRRRKYGKFESERR